MKRVYMASALLVVFLTGCGEKYARLYDLKTGEVLTAKYKGSGHGSIALTLVSGEILQGEFHTFTEGEIGWGAVYASVYGPAESSGSSGSGTALFGSARSTQQGTAIVVGNQGTVIECEYKTSSSGGAGACKDNRGNLYRLMF
jgi:hypothetical protein